MIPEIHDAAFSRLPSEFVQEIVFLSDNHHNLNPLKA